MRRFVLAVALSLGVGGVAWSGEADVIDVQVRRSAPGIFDFDVTVRSVDRGADYWADAFEVLTLDGKLLGRRVLLHSHEGEQPFTRDLYGVRVPEDVTEVRVRARHRVRGYDGETMIVRIPR